MELIIKPTELCNFACTFCSSTNLVEQQQTLPHEKIFRFLERFPKTNTIIVNGGDPLMVPPEYYFKILDHLDQHLLPATLSLTTNLWDFYKRPDRWAELFKHPRVGIATSFQYGGARRITKEKELTEEVFIDIIKKFNDFIGYSPGFIAVIDEQNEDTVIRTVELAKRLGVVCKLNYANASGRQIKPYPISKMYAKYLEVFERGLSDWEFSTKQMISSLANKDTTCPLSRDCDSNIRCLNPDGQYFSCGSFGDDKEFSIDFDKEMQGSAIATPLANSVYLNSLKRDCMICPGFNICNGCKKSVFDLKRLGTASVEEHCANMKQLLPKLQWINTKESYDRNNNDTSSTRPAQSVHLT